MMVTQVLCSVYFTTDRTLQWPLATPGPLKGSSISTLCQATNRLEPPTHFHLPNALSPSLLTFCHTHTPECGISQARHAASCICLSLTQADRHKLRLPLSLSLHARHTVSTAQSLLDARSAQGEMLTSNSSFLARPWRIGTELQHHQGGVLAQGSDARRQSQKIPDRSIGSWSYGIYCQ